MARLRLGLAGLLLLVLSATGFAPGGTVAAGTGLAASALAEGRIDPLRTPSEFAALAAMAADEPDEDLDPAEPFAVIAPARDGTPSAMTLRIAERRAVPPRATGPPALSTV